MNSPVHSSSPRFPGSFFARWAAPWAAGAWTLFLLWTAVVAAIWTWGIGEADVQARVAHPELRDALIWLLGIADPLWLTLAAINGYFALAATEGLNVARRWALVVAVAAFAGASFYVSSGWPLGTIRYTERLGPRLGAMPFGLPLLWFVVVLGARSLLLRLLPRASHGRIALGVGAIAAVFGAILEPVATKVRVWWFWRAGSSGAPDWMLMVQSAGIWLVVSAALAWLLRESRVARTPTADPLRPAIAFGLLTALALLAHLGRALGW